MQSTANVRNSDRPHSPLPWEANPESLVLLDPFGNVTADCDVETFESERPANAALIAVACNHHHALAGSLSRLVDISSVLCNLKHSKASIREDVWAALAAAVNNARLALNELDNDASDLPGVRQGNCI